MAKNDKAEKPGGAGKNDSFVTEITPRSKDFSRWYRDIMGYIGNLAGAPEPIELGLKAREELTAYFMPLIRERRAGSGTDLLSLSSRVARPSRRSPSRLKDFSHGFPGK